MKKHTGFALVEVTVVAIVIVAVIVGYSFLANTSQDAQEQKAAQLTPTDAPQDPAVTKGKFLGNENCSGTGPVTLRHSPMDTEDFAYIIPLGLMIDGHVTPIDHGYFEPADRTMPRSYYPVYAMADGTVTQIGSRDRTDQDGNPFEEYRLVFQHTCTFLTYYDLVTELSPKLRQAFDENKNGNYAYMHIDVVAGEEIGKIGQQTLDYAVWDTTTQLDGFVYPDHYESEAWKIHTANPFDYMTDELIELLMAKNLRYTEPYSGKIDHDIAGTLQGNWFLKRSNWYQGDGDPYWQGHLAFAPDHIDPTRIIFSIGDFAGDTLQAVIPATAPQPKDVTLETGLVAYDLYQIDYQTVDGRRWDRMTFEKGLTVTEARQTYGCVLVQIVGEHTMQLEPFPDKPCSSGAGFTTNARVYIR